MRQKGRVGRVIVIVGAIMGIALAAWAANEIKSTIVTEGYLRVNDGVELQAGTDGDYAAEFDGSKVTVKNASSATVISMTAGDNGERVGIGTDAPASRLHVKSASSGYAGTPSAAMADGEIIENDADVISEILTPNDKSGAVMFGDEDAEGRGGVRYDHATDDLELWEGGAKQAAITGPGTFQWNGHLWNWSGADGNSGDVLATNGGGTLQFIAASGGGGYWQRAAGKVSPLTSTDTVWINGPAEFGTNATRAGSLWVFGDGGTGGGTIWMYNGFLNHGGGYPLWALRPNAASLRISSYSGAETVIALLTPTGIQTPGMSPLSGTSLALNAQTLTSTEGTVSMWNANHANISAPNKMTTVKGTLNVDQAVTLDSTLAVAGNVSFAANLTTINGVGPLSWPGSLPEADNQVWAINTDGTVHYVSLAGISIPDDLELGAAATTQGSVTIYAGVSDEPAYIKMYSESGTPMWLFVDADWGLRVNTSEPKSDTDGWYPMAYGMKGSGSLTDAVDLDTAEVAGVLPASSLGNGVTDTQVNNNLTLIGATVDDTVIGGITPAAATFTDLTAVGMTQVNGIWITDWASEPTEGQGVLIGFNQSIGFAQIRAYDYDTSEDLTVLMQGGGMALRQTGQTDLMMLVNSPDWDLILDLLPVAPGANLISYDPLLLSYEPTTISASTATVFADVQYFAPSIGNSETTIAFVDVVDWLVEGNTTTVSSAVFEIDTAFTKRVSSTRLTEFSADDTSPSVASGNMFTVPSTWTAGHDVTDLDDGLIGQTVRICGGDGDCVFSDAGNLVLDGDWTANTDNIIVLTLWANGKWREETRCPSE